MRVRGKERERKKKNIAFRAVFIHHEWMKSPHFLSLFSFFFLISNLRQFSTNDRRNENLFLNFSIMRETIIIIFAYLHVGGRFAKMMGYYSILKIWYHILSYGSNSRIERILRKTWNGNKLKVSMRRVTMKIGNIIFFLNFSFWYCWLFKFSRLDSF